MLLSSIRFNTRQHHLKGWSLIEVTGADRESFFQGQVTNDVNALSVGNAHLSARLNRVGKIQSFFYLAKLSDRLYLMAQNELVQPIMDDLNKFIIMDDVELKKLDQDLYLVFNPVLTGSQQDKLFDLNFFGIEAEVVPSARGNMEIADEVELENIRRLNGYPLWNQDVNNTNFINDSYLNEIAISYKKGCFLGQETVVKIETNRGAAYYPVLLETTSKVVADLHKKDFYIEDKKAGTINYQVGTHLPAMLFRDFRVEGKKLQINIDGHLHEAFVHYFPFFKNQSHTAIAEELYHLGVEHFQAGDTDTAMNFMKRSIDFDPAFSDSYESIGVILGRKERYQEAIEWMDKLLDVKSSSVMAHTNKSLFLMKLGKIEEAEAEKAQATVKSFAMYGEEAKVKKALEAEKQKKEDDIKRREKMFLQVLEMDPDDTIALYGMADVSFFRGEYQTSISNLTRLVEIDPKYSTAYLLLGKSYEAQEDIVHAKEIYQKGIEVASKRGDMMPANEMQSRLNQLVVGSRLS
jgi:folate-binding protein YgfZ